LLGIKKFQRKPPSSGVKWRRKKIGTTLQLASFCEFLAGTVDVNAVMRQYCRNTE